MENQELTTAQQMKELSGRYIVSLKGQHTRDVIARTDIVSLLVNGNEPNVPAIIAQGTQLSLMTRIKGFEFTASIIGLIINDLCKNLNIKTPMSESQITALAIELAKKYWHYKLEDFVAFFNLVKIGVYGKIYDRLDAEVINQMLNQYDADRERQLEEIQMNPTRSEKYAREKSKNEMASLTTLAGAMSSVREMASKNRDQINRLDPNK